MKFFSFFGSLFFTLFVIVSSSFAGLEEADMTTITSAVTDSLTDVNKMAVAALTVLAGMYGVRKLVKFVNRS